MQIEATVKKGYKEDFAKFFENPSREGLREILRNHVGEFDELDFKREFPAKGDLARHVLAFANSGGGCIVFGVEQDHDKKLIPVGVTLIEDKSDIYKKLRKFIPLQLKYEVHDFTFDASEYSIMVGKKFQVLIVDGDDNYVPFLAMSDGDGIQQNGVYVRHGTNSDVATYEELQKIINRRIATDYSSHTEFDLQDELSKLKVLYDAIEGRHTKLLAIANPFYLLESFEEFVQRMIQIQKERIQMIIEGN